MVSISCTASCRRYVALRALCGRGVRLSGDVIVWSMMIWWDKGGLVLPVTTTMGRSALNGAAWRPCLYAWVTHQSHRITVFVREKQQPKATGRNSADSVTALWALIARDTNGGPSLGPNSEPKKFVLWFAFSMSRLASREKQCFSLDLPKRLSLSNSRGMAAHVLSQHETQATNWFVHQTFCLQGGVYLLTTDGHKSPKSVLWRFPANAGNEFCLCYLDSG